MDELIKEIVDYFSFLYKNEGFKFVDSTYYAGGGVVILKSSKLRIKFVREKGETTVDVGPAHIDGVYFNLFWIRKLLGENALPADNTKAYKHAEFLTNTMGNLISIMSSDSLEQTILQVEKMKKGQ